MSTHQGAFDSIDLKSERSTLPLRLEAPVPPFNSQMAG